MEFKKGDILYELSVVETEGEGMHPVYVRKSYFVGERNTPGNRMLVFSHNKEAAEKKVDINKDIDWSSLGNTHMYYEKDIQFFELAGYFRQYYSFAGPNLEMLLEKAKDFCLKRIEYHQKVFNQAKAILESNLEILEGITEKGLEDKFGEIEAQPYQVNFTHKNPESLILDTFMNRLKKKVQEKKKDL